MNTTTRDTADDSGSAAKEARTTHSPASFLEVLLKESDAPHCYLDFGWPSRWKTLLKEVKARVRISTDVYRSVSGPYIVESAAERYFALLQHARQSMAEMFTEAEFVIMLNTTCSPLWEWNPWVTVASMVADDNGMESWDELAKGSDLRSLMERLVALSPLQNAALVDVCEQVWRNGSDMDLAELLKAAGLPPALDGRD